MTKINKITNYCYFLFLVTISSCSKDAVPLKIGGTVSLFCGDSTIVSVNQHCNFTSSNSFVASVYDGMIKANHIGRAEIAVVATDSYESASIGVDVKPRITSLPEAEEYIGKSVEKMIESMPMLCSDNGYFHFRSDACMFISCRVENGIIACLFFVDDDSTLFRQYLEERYDNTLGLYYKDGFVAALANNIVAIKAKE